MLLTTRHRILLTIINVLFRRIKSFNKQFIKAYIYVEKLFLINIQESLKLSIYGIKYRIHFLKDKNITN
jgi:hypothetical protein